MRRTLSTSATSRLPWVAEAETPSLDLTAVKRTYRRFAGVYDALFGGPLQPGRLKAVAAVNTEPGQRILEVGVGTGLSLAAYRSDSRVVGIDACAEMLDKARERARRLSHVETLLEMDAQRIDFPDCSFDSVVALYTMTVVPDPRKVAMEMRRVCIPGGRIAIVNHFAPEQPILRGMESSFGPLLSKIGFRADMDMRRLADAMRLSPLEVRPANLFGYCKLALFLNE